MLRSLSYINLILLVCYFLAYLQNGSAFTVFGLLGATVFSWLILRRLEGQKPFRFAENLFAVITLGFCFWLTLGAVNQLLDAIDYQYFPFSLLSLISYSFLLAILLSLHVWQSSREYLLKKDE